MTTASTHLLKVFLCHASGDKPPVRELYKRLTTEGVDAWLDQEKLLPGQDWRMEIPRAVREADVVVICLSKKSITKEGYVQKEIRFALDIAEEKPEGTIFLIPARLEDCIVPERLSRWQWVDLYEENGFIRLLRSLKLRADAVGATIEPTSYVDSDKEREKRIKQLYTEGLAAYYTEDWDRACQRFQSILSEQPNHKNATEKLAEADRQRNLSRLYEQALEAVRSEDWGAAIQTLEELSKKSANYKDAAQLLRNARKQQQLGELYAEARTLHEAQKWEAVVRVFEQIGGIEPNYSDPDGLLPSAQKEVAELQRLAELNDLYSRGVEEMDAGHWQEARRLLETVHKSQTGFLETERLLKKVENEIAREEQKRRQNDQVNTLYEQAHGLLRSKKWRNALEKMEEIRKLDEHFPDVDGIAEKARKELAREEQEADRQNKLAALYAEAVKLLKEEKYQQALDKWGEVRAIDPKYPDRQRVHNTARKALSKQVKTVSAKPRFVMPKTLWIGLGGIVAIAVLVFAINQFGNGENEASLAQTIAPTDVVENTAPLVPTTTNLPQKTSTSRPATAVPASSGYSDPTMYDDFDNSAYDGSYNSSLWYGYSDSKSFAVNQKSGQISLTVNDQSEVGLNTGRRKIVEPTFFEVRLYLDPETTNSGTNLFIELNNDNGGSHCGISRYGNFKQNIYCFSEHYGKHADSNVNLGGIQPGWHVLRFDVDPETMIIYYVIDGKQSALFNPMEVIPDHFNEFKQSSYNFSITLHNWGPSKAPVGYLDYVRIGAIEDDPTVYDSFNNTTYDGRFDTTNWIYEQQDTDGSAIQQDGSLIFTQGGIGKGQTLGAKQYWPFKLQDSIAFEADLKVDTTSDGHVVMTIEGDVVTFVSCGLHSGSDFATGHCWTQSGDHTFSITHGTWHVVRIEIDLTTNMVTSYIDGKKLSEDRYTRSLRNSTLYLNINVWSGTNRLESTRPIIGYVDYVRVYPLEYVNP
jgi:outer membrane protein assembly factor BamD (BamD/ComL family)